MIGGEVPDQTYRVVRHVSVDDPDDLNSPMRYAVEVTDSEPDPKPNVTSTPETKPSAKRVLAIVDAEPDVGLTVKDIGDRLADTNHPLKARTIQAALQSLGSRVEGTELDARGTTQWFRAK